MLTRPFKSTFAVAFTLVLLAIAPTPALAAVEEQGIKNCPSSYTGKTHFQFVGHGSAWGPGGGTTQSWWFTDGLWHTKEVWGVEGGGMYDALGDPQLNTENTYGYCVLT